MRPRRFEPEQLQDLLNQPLPTVEIARRLKVSKSAVYNAVRRYGFGKIRRTIPARIAAWRPPHHWATYTGLAKKGLSATERRRIVEQDIARERRA